MAPSLQFYITILYSSLILILTFSYLDRYITIRQSLLFLILELLHKLNLINYFNNLAIQFFDRDPKEFNMEVAGIYFFCFVQAIVSKYLFLNHLKLNTFAFSWLCFLYILFFLGLFCLYFRILISTASIIFNISHVVLKMGDDLPPPSSSSSTGSSTSSGVPSGQLPEKNTYTFSLFNFNFNKSYNQEHIAKNTTLWKRAGFCVAFCTLGVGFYAAYQRTMQTQAALEQNRLALEQNREFVRQNDLEEVFQGMMTKEEYRRRHS